MSKLTNPNIPQKTDHIWYDTQTIATLAVQTNFFAAASTNIQLSNMVLANQFPLGERNTVRGIRIFVKTRNGATVLTARDIEELGFGLVQLQVQGRLPLVQRHAVQCPAGNGVYITDATAALAGVQNGFPSIVNTWYLNEPLDFQGEVFTFAINWVTAVVLSASAIVRAELITDRYASSG